MVNKKKGDYNFIFVIGILAALILVGAILYIAPRYNSQVIFNMNIDNSSKLMNDSYSVYITNDDDFGNVYYFKGTDYLKLNEKINATHGFSVSAFTFVADNKSRNNLGIVSTSTQNNVSGFRFKYRDFEEEDRIYVQIGDSLFYGNITNEKCYMNWCHFAFTYNPSGKTKIYLNGESVGTFYTDQGIVIDNRINVGNTITTNVEFFKGKISNVTVYDGVLSDSEIEEISKALENSQ